MEADIVVFALPFTTLRDVDMTGLALDARHRDAIDNLGMGMNRKVNLQFLSPVWEATSNGESYSDLATGGTWPTHPGMPGTQGILTAFPASAAMRRSGAQDPTKNGPPLLRARGRFCSTSNCSGR